MTNFFQQFLAAFRETPAYVSLISDRWIFISGNISNIGSLEDKVETIPNLYNAKGLRYSGEQHLVLLLGKLNAAGVRFLKDRKQANCPYSIMNDLRADGLATAEFFYISWTACGLSRTEVSREACNHLESDTLCIAAYSSNDNDR